jgi:hypothetical protein
MDRIDVWKVKRDGSAMESLIQLAAIDSLREEES